MLDYDNNNNDNDDNNNNNGWGIQYDEKIEIPMKKPGSKRQIEYKAPIGFNYDPKKLGDVTQYTLKNLVSSRQGRDIYRSANFMPGQFDEWNKNVKGGNNKYIGIYEDLDGDKINEFVVKRDGNIVAVNGYSTKNSDFPFRAKYYERYPNAEMRRGMPLKGYLADEYYKPQYTDDFSRITRWDGENPTTEEFKQKYKQFNTRVPKALSTYQAFTKLIIGPACKQAFLSLAGNNENKAKIVRQVAADLFGKKMIESYIASVMYSAVIKLPVLNYLNSNNRLEMYQHNFEFMKKRYNPGFKINFENQESAEYKLYETWLFNQSEVKAAVTKFANKLLTQQRAQAIDSCMGVIINKLQGLKGFNDAVEAIWKKKQTQIDQGWNIGGTQT